MNYKLRKHGFSLTEVLMAAVILAVGLVMIAGTFPVGIFLTAGSVEQTIAPIVADEAIAKMQLYGVNVGGLTTTACVDFNSINVLAAAGNRIDPNEYLYPSINTLTDRVYNWSAICRRVNPNLNDRLVQVTVFVSRKTGASLKYYQYDNVGNTITTNGGWPTPVRFNVITTNGSPILKVTFDAVTNGAQQKFITDGCTIVADAGGNNVYRVLDHYKDAVGTDIAVVLDKNWESGVSAAAWIVPPPTSGGRSPCIGVYQRIIKF